VVVVRVGGRSAGGPVTAVDRRKRAFRSADEFTLEAFRAARIIMVRTEGKEIAEEIRRCCARCGGFLVAASGTGAGGEGERRYLERARDRLLEARYLLYVARRTGLLDLRPYRQLTARQDSALREVELLLREAISVREERPP
jgi:hypothetical protein